MENHDSVSSYGLINIYYGTTNGNSKQLAYEFVEEAEKHGFIPKITCMGDFAPHSFIPSNFSVFFLSTYGVGGPTEDSERFFEWISKLAESKKPVLSHLKFIMFGLGNSNFQFFGGMSKKVREFLLELGAFELHPITISDAKTHKPLDVYMEWKEGLFNNLFTNHSQHFSRRSYSVEELKKLTNPFTVTFTEEIHEVWEETARNASLRHEMSNYLSCDKAKVLQITQIRKDNSEGRETFFVRLEKPKDLVLTPACNIELFPQNQPSAFVYKGSIKVEAVNPDDPVPFPHMPLNEFYKILNLSQRITKSFLQDALISCRDEQKRQKYLRLIKNDAEWVNTTLTCGEVAEDLKTDLVQMLQLGVNTPRLYTLAGWHDSEIHLLVSVLKKDGKYGLTSGYLKSMPKSVRIKSSGSHFKLPENKEIPLVMIANGSGMAPFRSILQYNRHLKQQGEKTYPLILFYGCQKLSSDFYFADEWAQAQKEGLVQEVNIATSREGANQYIQKLLMQEKDKLKELLINRNATFLVCGSESMGKEINNVLIEVYKSTGEKPYQSLMKVKKLEKDGRLVKEIFG